MLCVLWTGRDTLPCGGRGTERPAGLATLLPNERVALLFAGAEIRLLIKLGGRGTLWFIAVCVGSERDGKLRCTEPTPLPRGAPAVVPRPMICGGRGMERPAEAGVAMLVRPAV